MQPPSILKAIARPFYRAAALAFEHARQHVNGDTELDAVQVILSLDYGVEMLLKAILMNRGEDIMPRRKVSLSLSDALDMLPELKNGPSIKILRDRRDNMQHLAAPSKIEEAIELYEATMDFVAEALKTEFNQELPEDYVLSTAEDSKKLSVAQVLYDTNELQRDVYVQNGIVVWSQGHHQNLAVYMMDVDGTKPIRLTPSGKFEYMPITDGTRIATVRQEGGIVVYDAKKRTRSILHENGLPNSITSTHLSAQGLNISDGLGGGIDLYNFKSKRWQKISESGDNSRLSGKYIYWNDYLDGKYRVFYREIKGGEIKELASDATWVTASNDLVAYTEYPAASSKISVVDHKGKVYFEAERGIFPHLNGDLIAYLKNQENKYSLVVANVKTGQILQDEDWVGFPTGRGPQIYKDLVFFETTASKQVNKIMIIEIYENPY